MTIRPNSLINSQPISQNSSKRQRPDEASSQSQDHLRESSKTGQVAEAVLKTPPNNTPQTSHQDKTIKFLNGMLHTQKDLFIKVIHSNPQMSKAYYKLANFIGNQESIQLLSGEPYTKKGLYLKVIELNPNKGKAYHKLAKLMDKEESAQLLNG
ncbi:MAG: tetratricopeptide repeat protein, partial [Candidatus Rhabdochlamydia sp.]